MTFHLSCSLAVRHGLHLTSLTTTSFHSSTLLRSTTPFRYNPFYYTISFHYIVPLHFRSTTFFRSTTPFHYTSVLLHRSVPLHRSAALSFHYILPFQYITPFQYRFVCRTFSSLPLLFIDNMFNTYRLRPPKIAFTGTLSLSRILAFAFICIYSHLFTYNRIYCVPNVFFCALPEVNSCSFIRLSCILSVVYSSSIRRFE